MDEAKELFGKGSLENVHEDNFDGEKEINNIENQITKLGDLWILDDHRLVCGDSTNDEYYKLVLDGKKADLIETDPPYNIDYGETISGDGRDIANDNLSEEEFYHFLLDFYTASFENIKKGGPLYVFHPQRKQ